MRTAPAPRQSADIEKAPAARHCHNVPPSELEGAFYAAQQSGPAGTRTTNSIPHQAQGVQPPVPLVPLVPLASGAFERKDHTMRLFMDANGQVVVVFGDSAQPPSTFIIPDDVAQAAELTPGDVLPDQAQAAVREGDWEFFLDGLPDSELESDGPVGEEVPEDEMPPAWEAAGVGDELPADALPPPGRWQYRVVALTELGGFATAKGTAARVQEVLNDMGAEGWELVAATDRASRYLSGESMLLTLRRWVTTEGEFVKREMAEARLRRVVARSLDLGADGEAGDGAAG